jgi:hypothetical protein
LWERRQPEGAETIDSCTIIVTTANEIIRQIDDRMPVILAPQDYDLWLDPEIHETDKLTPLVKPYPAEEMELYPMGFGVNSPKHDGEGLIKRLQENANTRLFLQRFIQVMQRVQQAIEDAATRALAPYRIVQLPAHVVASVLCPASRFFAAFTTIEFRLDRFFGCHGILTILYSSTDVNTSVDDE